MRIGIIFVVVVAATTVLPAADSVEINVGGATTWRIPSEPNFYSSWVSRETIALHDILVFRFAADGNNNVAGVAKEAYDNCDTNNPKFVNHTTPFRFRLDKLENYYFICTVATTCSAGQKLAITNIVAQRSSTTVTPSPPPPPPNSASALASTFISTAVAALIIIASQ